ncbi:MAG: hypothetical protein ACLQMO_07955 [Acidobacteriaceae bacterium]
MTKHNPENERIKRKYFAYLKEGKRHSEPTVDAAAKALSRFEEYTRYRDFKAFHYDQAIAFKRLAVLRQPVQPSAGGLADDLLDELKRRGISLSANS